MKRTPLFLLLFVKLVSATAKGDTKSDSLSSMFYLKSEPGLRLKTEISEGSYMPSMSDITKESRSHDLFLGIAATGGGWWGGPLSYTIGGEVFLQKDLGRSLSATISAGYVQHVFDSDRTSWSTLVSDVQMEMIQYLVSGYDAIPLKGGIRIYTGKRLFLGGEIGGAFGLKQSGILRTTDASGSVERRESRAYSSFLYAVSGGYSFDNGLEAGIKFEDYPKFSNIKSLNVRIAYRFKL